MNILLDKRQLLTFGLPGLVILSSVVLALSPLLRLHPELAIGITYDLTLLAPLVYFLLIRKRKIPKVTVVPFFVIGVVLADVLLPEHRESHLQLVKTLLLPAVELAVLAAVLHKVYKAVQAFRQSPSEHHDFFLTIQESAGAVIDSPKVAKVFATEIAMFYYAFFAWRKPVVSANSFTSYKSSGTGPLLVAIVMILGVETVALHLLLALWSELVAWVLTAISLYTVVQLLGHLKAMRYRHTELQDGYLFLKYGLFGDMKVPLSQIRQVELTTRPIKDSSVMVEKLALLSDLEGHNVAIYFSEEQEVEKVYGIKRKCDVALFYIDKKDEFLQQVNEAMQKVANH